MVWSDLYLLRQLGIDLKHGYETTHVQDLLISHLLKIRGKKGGLKPLKMNRSQCELSRRWKQKNIVLKARQVGITTYVAARFFIQTITRPGTLTVQVAHSQEAAEAIFKLVKRFWENLPVATQAGALITSRANVRQMTFPRLDSEFRVETADANAGRGMTIHNLHCSEVSRWPRGGEEALASLRAAVVPKGEIVLESTPNGAGGMFYDEWQRAAEHGYARHFFPWWFEESYVDDADALELSDEEQTLMRRHGLSARQIAWRRKQHTTMRRLAMQEYAEDALTCFLTSNECVFDVEGIEEALANAQDPTEIEDNGRLQAWFPPKDKGRYVIGVDTAGGGTGGDFACVQVVDRMLGVQCAELHGHFPPYELARRVVELGRRYNRALVAVERNNHGYGVLAHLRNMKYDNIYERDGQEGWLTSAVTRPAMIENLAAMFMEMPRLFQSRRLLGEMRTFVRRADGNAAAADGAHDDCVMAMAVAMAVRQETAGRMARREAREWMSLEPGWGAVESDGHTSQTAGQVGTIMCGPGE